MPAKENLILGWDYYIEKGNVVFTERYLLKRGECCNNGCRHCPWRDKSPDVDPAESSPEKETNR